MSHSFLSHMCTNLYFVQQNTDLCILHMMLSHGRDPVRSFTLFIALYDNVVSGDISGPASDVTRGDMTCPPEFRAVSCLGVCRNPTDALKLKLGDVTSCPTPHS